MINLLEFYKTYTTYDGVRLALLSLVIITGVMLHAYYSTKSRKVQIVNVFSWVLVELVFMSSLLIVKNLFNVQLTLMAQGIYFGLLFLQALNLMLVTDFFVEELRQKHFDIDHISRKHFRFSLNIALLIVLLITSGLLFIENSMLWVLLTFAVDTVIMAGFTHLIVRSTLKEPFNEKLKK